MIQNKFSVGQEVFLFNSISMRIESDIVYAILFAPVAVEGVAQHSDKLIGERISSGEMVVKEQYQLAGHQGVLDAGVLFSSEGKCFDFYRKFFSSESSD